MEAKKALPDSKQQPKAEQPRIVIELEGFEDLLASTSETFNEKIVEAILASEDLD